MCTPLLPTDVDCHQQPQANNGWRGEIFEKGQVDWLTYCIGRGAQSSAQLGMYRSKAATADALASSSIQGAIDAVKHPVTCYWACEKDFNKQTTEACKKLEAGKAALIRPLSNTNAGIDGVLVIRTKAKTFKLLLQMTIAATHDFSSKKVASQVGALVDADSYSCLVYLVPESRYEHFRIAKCLGVDSVEKLSQYVACPNKKNDKEDAKYVEPTSRQKRKKPDDGASALLPDKSLDS